MGVHSALALRHTFKLSDESDPPNFWITFLLRRLWISQASNIASCPDQDSLTAWFSKKFATVKSCSRLVLSPLSCSCSGMEENPRPQKRARTTPPTDISCAIKNPENQLHGAQLLLALPSLLVYPPTHSEHKRSLALSLLALRRCLGLPNSGGTGGGAGRKGGTLNGAGSLHLSQPDECRAWCALAEIGLCVIEGGFSGEAWATGIENEVDKALGKAVSRLVLCFNWRRTCIES